MRYFLVVLFSALWQAILARGLHENPVLYDLERRLVRLEDRQFSESQNLEHRLLQMEVQLGTQQGDDKFLPIQLESTYNVVDEAKAVQSPSSNDLKLMERLEIIEKNWEKDLQEELSKLSSNYDILEEKFSAIENQVKETIGSAEIGDNLSSSRHLFKKIGKKYYRIEEENTLSWRDAYEKCIGQDAKLASLQNEEEWDAIRDHLESDKSYWVDVNDIVREGNYVSGTSDRKAPFLKWEAREPNHLSSEMGDEDCVELRRDYNHYMNDIICSQENYYICELNSDF